MKCPNPLVLRDANKTSYSVPCGKCIFCKTNRLNEWVNRLRLEHINSKSAYFVTLTYDEFFKPEDNTLHKEDIQKFMKRLRHSEKNSNLKYYCVGEYGEKSGRPHWHMILFNLENTKNIEKNWKNGFIHIGKFEIASVKYVLGYMKEENEKERNVFISQGIGLNYVNQYIDWHKQGKRFYCQINDQKFKIPRYIKNKIFSKQEKDTYKSELIKKYEELDEKLKNELISSNDNYFEHEIKRIDHASKKLVKKLNNKKL